MVTERTIYIYLNISEFILLMVITDYFFFKHTLQRNLPLVVHLVLAVLGVPAVDGPSQLWRSKGQTALQPPVRRGTLPSNVFTVYLLLLHFITITELSPSVFVFRKELKRRKTKMGM